ncbi:universal stress protein [Streptomyces sp. NPDC020983]|uniref:universal stress protein n=1 Tax=Streptomyces sp. NPDC020983 TaxID=3365106 RepID=UPI0037B134A5
MRQYAVAGVDGSDGGRRAARWAAAEAGARGLALRLVTVVPPGLPRAPSTAGSTRRAEPVPGPAGVPRDIALAHPDLEVDAREIAGEPSQVLPGAGQGAALLVVGTRGAGGFDGPWLGSVALAVAVRAPCPVALVPAPSPVRGRRHEVVVGVDARHPDEGAVGAAFEEAASRGALLRAVHAWDLPAPGRGAAFGVLEEDRAEWEDQEVQLLDDALRGWREKYPQVSVLPDVRLFGAADALVRVSAGAELLVVGRGQPKAARLRGVARAVAHRTPCPLLLAGRG